jgi:hypothetical protein
MSAKLFGNKSAMVFSFSLCSLSFSVYYLILIGLKKTGRYVAIVFKGRNQTACEE